MTLSPHREGSEIFNPIKGKNVLSVRFTVSLQTQFHFIFYTPTKDLLFKVIDFPVVNINPTLSLSKHYGTVKDVIIIYFLMQATLLFQSMILSMAVS